MFLFRYVLATVLFIADVAGFMPARHVPGIDGPDGIFIIFTANHFEKAKPAPEHSTLPMCESCHVNLNTHIMGRLRRVVRKQQVSYA
jgi:hypothetical protein